MTVALFVGTIMQHTSKCSIFSAAKKRYTLAIYLRSREIAWSWPTQLVSLILLVMSRSHISSILSNYWPICNNVSKTFCLSDGSNVDLRNTFLKIGNVLNTKRIQRVIVRMLWPGFPPEGMCKEISLVARVEEDCPCTSFNSGSL